MWDGRTDGPVPESLRLWSLCKNMEFSHLPVAGGIYDQDPKLVSQWEEIFRAVNEKAKHDADKAERDAANKK